MLKSNFNKILLEEKFSGVVSIEKQDVCIFENAFGFAERSNKIKNNLNTRFNLASGTATFTSICIGLLLQNKQIKLSDKIFDILGVDILNYDKNITIKHLLTQTSGIANSENIDFTDDAKDYYLEIPWYFLKELSDYVPLFQNYKMTDLPGNKFHYSSINFLLLGMIIEKITKLNYKKFVSENIFTPLKMSDSGFFSMDSLPKNSAYGYLKGKTGNWKTNLYSMPIIGSAHEGSWSSCHDLSKFYNGLNNNLILNNEIKEQLLNIEILVGQQSNNYYCSLGFYHLKDKKNIYSFSGCNAGIGFVSKYIIEDDILINILSNKTYGHYSVQKKIDKVL